MKNTLNETRMTTAWSRWIPTPGTVIFTLLALAIFLGAQSVGALPANAPLAATASRSTIAYQGRLTHSDGSPVNAKKPMIFRLYNTPSDGTALWEEKWEGQQYAIQVVGGQFHVMLGSLTPIPPSVVNGNEALFLAVAVDGDDEMSPRLQLGSMPYAMQALTVPDKSITTAQIADGAVGTAQIANGTVTKAKLGADVKFTAQTGYQASSTDPPYFTPPGDIKYYDIPGTARTITVDAPSTLVVNAALDLAILGVSGAQVGYMGGGIFVNGTQVGMQAAVSGLYHTRATAATSGVINIEPGTHTIKLMVMSYNNGNQVWNHTGYNYIVFPR